MDVKLNNCNSKLKYRIKNNHNNTTTPIIIGLNITTQKKHRCCKQKVAQEMTKSYVLRQMHLMPMTKIQ
jgi:hypothetical protein